MQVLIAPQLGLVGYPPGRDEEYYNLAFPRMAATKYILKIQADIDNTIKEQEQQNA